MTTYREDAKAMRTGWHASTQTRADSWRQWTSTTNPERLVDKEAVAVVDNVLLLVVAHHDDLVDDQFLPVPQLTISTR